ncbi:hypothetical protein QO002_001794 [Pararhizobium capsulatum DSM 1112]|uniref:Succinoglycan biosynthesis protein ExoI n=1 Tax=Pararhizobium capsulatum DSM 1112 TaxID=1121113 RepID=A0ABU0BPQ4_9HYPH|nr:succinoglycan biosynthesis protein exoi [Pararhizobium capsulatum]MDQ0319656.1 hypothetical protein [Pararhizobium capsulatum DSM 1112]
MRHRQFQKKPNRQSFISEAPGIVLGVVALGIAGYYSVGDLFSSVAAMTQGCEIKGNISINSGEKIFHTPGQEDYDQTRISPEYGERWFCSEAEARAAGWRKAGR